MANHKVYISLVVYMDDMDGTPEQSADIAYEQVSAVLEGRESEYGTPTWTIEAVEHD